MKETDLYSIDWVKFIERKQSLFLMSAFIRPEFPMLAEVTGFKFEHEFSVQKGPYCAWYRSQKELDACDEYFAALLAAKDPRLEEWAVRCVELYREADALLLRFSAPDSAFDPSEYSSLMRVIEQIFLYSAEIDFFVLMGIELLQKRGTPNSFLERYLALFEPLRAQSRYPQLGAVIFPRMWEAARKLQPEINEELISFATPIEIGRLFEGKLLDIDELKKRTDWCLYWQVTDEGDFEFRFDRDVDIAILKEKTERVSEFKGTVACKGKATGKVRIVSAVDEMQGFQEGEILVGINTNPALLPAMMKCAAIVTDEGGIASHAAIVSRELKKPCIIGTKVATQVLKTGDMVEVDAENGIVRRI